MYTTTEGNFTEYLQCNGASISESLESFDVTDYSLSEALRCLEDPANNEKIVFDRLTHSNTDPDRY